MRPFRWPHAAVVPRWLPTLWGGSALVAVVCVLLLGLEARPVSWQALNYLLLAPLLEEYLFRLGAQAALSAWLERLPNRACARQIELVVMAALFALAHFFGHSQGTWLWWLIPGYALAYTWQREQHLFWNVATHMWFNGALWIASMLLPGMLNR